MNNNSSLNILNSIRAFINQHGFPPSVRDIMQSTNINSTSMVRRHLKKLEDDGYIERTPEVARSIVIKQPQQPNRTKPGHMTPRRTREPPTAHKHPLSTGRPP